LCSWPSRAPRSTRSRSTSIDQADAIRNKARCLGVRLPLYSARDLGARIAVNGLTCDPGTQIQRLVELAPDIVKLDAGYTATLVGNRDDRGQAAEFLLNCTRSGMLVVGVGVEQPEDLDVLRELGVEAAQGYLFGQPRPIASYSDR
jgi:EAL domain-containing protein (putative c-di-GMP-specific phosphodiesterase class I)